MNIIALQTDIQWENREANFITARRLLSQAAPEKDSLVILPEMFATGFSMYVNAELMEENTPQFLAATAQEYQICLLGGVKVRGADNRVRNVALGYSPSGQLLVNYAKMHPFTLGGEARHCQAGHQPEIFHWREWTIAPFICYDLRFPEIFRQAAAVHRPQLFVIMANWPQKRIHHWIRLLQARAIENQAYVVGVNRCGEDPEHTYNGRSLVIDFHGEIIADAGDGETWINARLDKEALTQYRLKLPFLKDLRMNH